MSGRPSKKPAKIKNRKMMRAKKRAKPKRAIIKPKKISAKPKQTIVKKKVINPVMEAFARSAVIRRNGSRIVLIRS